MQSLPIWTNLIYILFNSKEFLIGVQLVVLLWRLTCESVLLLLSLVCLIYHSSHITCVVYTFHVLCLWQESSFFWLRICNSCRFFGEFLDLILGPLNRTIIHLCYSTYDVCVLVASPVLEVLVVCKASIGKEVVKNSAVKLQVELTFRYTRNC